MRTERQSILAIYFSTGKPKLLSNKLLRLQTLMLVAAPWGLGVCPPVLSCMDSNSSKFEEKRLWGGGDFYQDCEPYQAQKISRSFQIT